MAAMTTTATRRTPEWETAAARGDFAAAVLDLVRRRDWVTFAELDRLLSPFAPEAGSAAIYAAESVLWDVLPEPVAAAVAELLRRKVLYLWPTSPLVYVADGRILPVPAAAWPRGGRGHKTRWWPACLRLVRPARASLARLWKEIDTA